MYTCAQVSFKSKAPTYSLFHSFPVLIPKNPWNNYAAQENQDGMKVGGHIKTSKVLSKN